jgi:hypothetical protein
MYVSSNGKCPFCENEDFNFLENKLNELIQDRIDELKEEGLEINTAIVLVNHTSNCPKCEKELIFHISEIEFELDVENDLDEILEINSILAFKNTPRNSIITENWKLNEYIKRILPNNSKIQLVGIITANSYFNSIIDSQKYLELRENPLSSLPEIKGFITKVNEDLRFRCKRCGNNLSITKSRHPTLPEIKFECCDCFYSTIFTTHYDDIINKLLKNIGNIKLE